MLTRKFLPFVAGASVGQILAPSVWAQEAEQVDFNAGISLAEEYTDNVFATSNDRRDDFVTIIAPWARLSLTGENFSLGLDAKAELGRYADYSSEDYDDYSLGADFRYQFNREFFVFGGLEFAHEHESRSSPDAVFGIEPTVYDETSGYFGIGGRIDERRYRFGVNVRDLDFDEVDSISGIPIDNDGRDRTHLEVGGRIGVSKTENGEVFVQGIYDKRDYDTAAERDSDGLRAAVGYTGSIGSARGEVMLGILSQDYEGPAFDTVTAPDFGLDLSWAIGDSTRLTGIVERSLEETTLTGASGYLATSAGLRLRHRVSQNVSLAGYFFLTQNDYRQTDRTDYLTETGLSLRYYFNPRVYLDTDYSFQQRQSGAAGAEYDEHRISLRLGAALDDYYDEGTGSLASWGASSFYVGGHVGDLATQTKVDGPRGSNGFLTADFGDNSPVGGLFAGYRANLNDLVLGLEAEVEFNDGEWTHSGERNFSVERGNAYSLSAISGLRTPGNALLYGRFGAISSNFTSQYQLHSGPVVTREESELGFLLGVGAEIPLNGGLSGRMEYQLRAYDDYWIGAPQGGAGDDNFANVESVARFGLVYEFNSTVTPPEAPIKTNFGGAYFAGHLGHGTVQSENSGPRPNATMPSFVLDTTRSGQGFTAGVMAGYGYQSGRFYLGSEVELELSSANWNIERSPDRRLYSVEKSNSVGAAIRVGYVLNDAALFYARFGYVQSEFDTSYSYRGRSFDQDDTLGGFRIGAGVEFPLKENLNARLEYTQTDYDSHQVDYGAGTDQFDTSERLFRVGVSYAF